jgi:hypothetical protein
MISAYWNVYLNVCKGPMTFPGKVFIRNDLGNTFVFCNSVKNKLFKHSMRPERPQTNPCIAPALGAFRVVSEGYPDVRRGNPRHDKINVFRRVRIRLRKVFHACGNHHRVVATADRH